MVGINPAGLKGKAGGNACLGLDIEMRKAKGAALCALLCVRGKSVLHRV